MNAAPPSQAGEASGINNAVSRVASLLAVALFGLVLTAVFNRSLDRRLDSLPLPPVERQEIDQQRPQLAAAKTSDLQAQRAIANSFVDGYNVILWIAVGLGLASAVSAFVMIEPTPIGSQKARG
jgi:hypothetical protein